MQEPVFNYAYVQHHAFGDGGVTVACVKVDADLSHEQQLEQAYRATQNIDGSWSRGQYFENGKRNRDFNPFVSVMAKLPVVNGKTYGLRSTSVDDVIVLREAGSPGWAVTRYRVAVCGFERIEA